METLYPYLVDVKIKVRSGSISKFMEFRPHRVTFLTQCA